MARTIRNKFFQKLTYDSLMDAHLKSRKGKGYRKEIIKFNLQQEDYIRWLYDELKSGRYRHGGYTTFYITEPKLRKIEKSRYIDRIVHRWVVDNFLEEYFVKQFISTSFACIKGKGTHKAVLKVQEYMKHCSRIWKDYYIIKMDVKKYFENIDKEILIKILSKKIQDNNLLNLLKEIIYSNGKEKSLAIGNYTSQVFANIYLNELDQYVKHELKIKYFCRYMDDAIVLVKSKDEAILYLEKIREFLNANLKLELNRKTQIFKSKQGVNFCGYKVNEYRIKIRDRGKKNLKKKIKYLKHEIKFGRIDSKEAKRFLAGHYGYIKYANKYNLIKNLFCVEDI